MTYYITRSGRKIDIQNLSIDDICLIDIAHHLAKICRYGGALSLEQHYSVAQHSLQLASWAMKQGHSLDVQRALLMHDATEAYLGDIVSGLKTSLPDYEKIEGKVAQLIKNKYQLWYNDEILKIIKEADNRIILDEALYFMPDQYPYFSEQLTGLEPLGIDLYNELGSSKGPNFTYQCFLDAAKLLFIADYKCEGK